MNKSRPMRRGAAMTVFLAGLLLEGVVIAAAFWGQLSTWVADEVDRVAPVEPASAEPVPAATTPAPPATAPVAPAAGIQALRERIDEGLPELEAVCWRNFGPGDQTKASLQSEIVVRADGAVERVAVDAADAGLRACLEAEIGMWTFPAPGRTMSLRYRLAFH